MKAELFCPDAILSNADWTKRGWDLPPYRSAEFFAWLRDTDKTLEEFQRLPVYKHAIASGQIWEVQE